jgi:restriction system protein
MLQNVQRIHDNGGERVARKRKSSTAQDLRDLVALLLSRAGIALALASSMAAHAITIRPLAKAQSPQQIGQLATTIWQGLEAGGRYILSILCLAGAAVSAVRGRRRTGLLHAILTNSGAGIAQNTSWRMLQTQIGEEHRYQGHLFRQAEEGLHVAWNLPVQSTGRAASGTQITEMLGSLGKFSFNLLKSKNQHDKYH